MTGNQVNCFIFFEKIDINGIANGKRPVGPYHQIVKIGPSFKHFEKAVKTHVKNAGLIIVNGAHLVNPYYHAAFEQ